MSEFIRQVGQPRRSPASLFVRRLGRPPAPGVAPGPRPWLGSGLVLATLLLVFPPWVPLGAAQQPVALEQGLYAEIAFNLPGTGWERLTSPLADGSSRRALQYRRAGDGRLLGLSLIVIPIPPIARGLSAEEVAALRFRSVRDTQLVNSSAGNYTDVRERRRLIAGVEYPSLAFRYTPTNEAPIDEEELLYIPTDFSEHGRYYSFLWVETHLAGVAPAGTAEFDSVIASVVLRPLGTMLFEDTFDDSALGRLAQRASDPTRAQLGYLEGEYQIARIDESWGGTPGVVVPGTHSNVSVAVDARFVGEGLGRTVSLACRREGNPASSYRFSVSDRGRYRLARVDQGDVVVLLDWTEASVIAVGEDVNRLELTCAGNLLTVGVNGSVLASFTDQTYVEGSVWLGVGAPAGDTVDVRFENLVVTQR